MFNIRKYLTDNGIVFHEFPEKNTSKGWVSIQCVFPGCPDISNHLGINLRKGNYSCFKCGTSGFLQTLVREISNEELNDIKEEYGEATYSRAVQEETKRSLKVNFPFDVLKKFTPEHRNYLAKREFNVDYLINKYNLKATSPFGKFGNRIIIPYFLKNKLVTYSGRSITNDDPKYLHLPAEESIYSTKETIYNLDSVKETILIVEGVTGSWRFGDGCVAMSGTKYKDRQMQLLLKYKNVKNCFVMFDPDALQIAYRLARRIGILYKHTEVIALKNKDPGEFTDKEAVSLKKEIKLI